MFQFALLPLVIIFAIATPAYFISDTQNTKQNAVENKNTQTQTRVFDQILPNQSQPSLVRDFNPTRGPKNAKITVVVFMAFQCPACKATFPAEEQISQKYSDKVRFVYKMFPLQNIHAYAGSAAKSALAAAKQGKYFEYSSQLFLKQNNPGITLKTQEQIAQDLGLDMDKWNLDRDSAQINNAVKADFNDGQNAKIPDQKNPTKIQSVDSTPTFVFMRDDQILFKTNGLTTDEFSEKLDGLLK